MHKIQVKTNVENLIYEIRGKQVMLDSDLAKLYKCSNGTKDINKAVNRNIDRFPEDFYFQLTIEKYNKQYHNLKIIYNNTFHDRYIILDNKEAYHCGASINHTGSKTFSINKIEDEFIINLLINKIGGIYEK